MPSQAAQPPQVVAHRGASDALAEHTLAAYRQAVREGADALECDVRLTADGHLVCLHDRRVERTSDGRGVVSSLELADLHDLDFASWKQRPAAVAPEQSEAPERDDDRRVLTLQRLLDTVVAADRRVELAIETKHPTRYAGLVERRLIELLASYGWDGMQPETPVRVMSYSWASLRRVHERAPGLPTVYLMDRIPLRLRDGTLPRGVSIAGLSIRTLRTHPEQVARWHSRGHRVHVFTVNTDADVDLCLAAGVDALITDRPAHVRHLLR